MTIAELREKVIKIVSEGSGVKVEEIKPESKLVDDLGVDELDSVEIVMNLEEEFDVDILDEDVEKLITIEELVAYIHPKIKEEPIVPVVKTDEELLATEDDKLNDEEKARKIVLVEKNKVTPKPKEGQE